jgi:NTE family protein
MRQGGRTLGFVLSGGGARGAFQVGAFERLVEDGRFNHPAVIAGTSAGAINAALIAAGRTPAELRAFWLGIADDPPVVASPAFFWDVVRGVVGLGARELRRWTSDPTPARGFLQRLRNHLTPRPGQGLAFLVEYLLTSRFELVSEFLASVRVPFIADTSRLRERLVEAVGGERIPNRGIRLAINTVDARSGHVVRWVTAPSPLMRSSDYVVVDAITVDMVLASASIPLLFPMVRIGSRLLWDGGLLVNTPLAPAVALGADEIITILVTEGPDERHDEPPSFGWAVERAIDSFLENAYNVDRKLLLERNQIARATGGRYRDVRLYQAVRPERGACFSVGSYLYFERRVIEDLHAAGRAAASDWLRAGPGVDTLGEPPASAVPAG